MSRLVTYLRIVAREDARRDPSASERARADAARARRAERWAREIYRLHPDPEKAEELVRAAVLDELEAARRERLGRPRGAGGAATAASSAARTAAGGSPPAASEDARDPTISSRRLAEGAQATAFQVRKDLAYFGRFGTRGAGYPLPALHAALLWILNLTRPWRVAVVGMGRLGTALVDYPGLREYAFELVAGFDADPAKVGRPVGGIAVHDVADLATVAARRRIDIAFLTVPPDAAQGAADAVVAAGVTGILNFAPAVLEVPPHVRVEPVDFLAGLKRLSFYIQEPELEEEST